MLSITLGTCLPQPDQVDFSGEGGEMLVEGWKEEGEGVGVREGTYGRWGRLFASTF
jgi:hypothetical protein